MRKRYLSQAAGRSSRYKEKAEDNRVPPSRTTWLISCGVTL
ncbi:MAG: hypothetical protein ACTSXC_08600 [Candidatus Freyarchaeota archaeon]